MLDTGEGWEGVPLLEQTPAQTLKMIGEKIAQSPIGAMFSKLFGGGDNSQDTGFDNGRGTRVSYTPSQTPMMGQQQPVVSQEKAISIDKSLDAGVLASLKGLGETIKTGKAPEGVAKIDSIAFSYDASVMEASAPLPTPNRTFGQSFGRA